MSFAPLLALQNLHVSVEGKEVVRGVSLSIPQGEVHAIMGPNGSGKSSLVSALAGHPAYTVTEGSAEFLGEDLLAMPPHERALQGLFLAFQYPREIAGVSLRSFLLAAHRARAAADTTVKRLSPLQFEKILNAEMKTLAMDPAFLERSVNKGFSGGEKKKAEILQMTVLQPKLALLDETDSGLDVDALRTVAEGVVGLRASRGELRKNNSQNSPSILIVTHYARILDYLTPDRVHVMVRGKIVESGGADLALKLEKEGYRKFGVTEEGGIVLEA